MKLLMEIKPGNISLRKNQAATLLKYFPIRAYSSSCFMGFEIYSSSLHGTRKIYETEML